MVVPTDELDACPFCRLDPQAPLVYEDELAIAMVPPDPINKYQVLVIPRRHYVDFVDIPDDLASHLFLLTKRLSQAVRDACHPDGMTHISDDDITRCGLNMLSHYKIHIIPRFRDEHITIDWAREGSPGQIVRKQRSDEIRAAYLAIVQAGRL